MSLHILYTPRAKETLGYVYHFIHNQFGKRSADKFALKAEKTIKLITDYPLMFKATVLDENIRIV